MWPVLGPEAGKLMTEGTVSCCAAPGVALYTQHLGPPPTRDMYDGRLAFKIRDILW